MAKGAKGEKRRFLYAKHKTLVLQQDNDRNNIFKLSFRPELHKNKTAISTMLKHRRIGSLKLTELLCKRVSIIQQLLKGSNFLLLDEPFSGLDVCMLDKVTHLLLRVSLSDELKNPHHCFA